MAVKTKALIGEQAELFVSRGWGASVSLPPIRPVKLRLPLFLMIAGQVADLVTTLVGISSGKLVEVNPIAKLILNHGLAAITGFKVLFVMIVLACLTPSPPKRRRRALLFVAAVGLLISLSNALQTYL
jgi:hypothetical protein